MDFMNSVQGHALPLPWEMTECTLVTGTGRRHPPCELTAQGPGHSAASAWQGRIYSTIRNLQFTLFPFFWGP